MPDFINNMDWAEIFKYTGIIVLQLIAIIIAFFIVKAVAKNLITKSFKHAVEKENILPGRAQTLEKLSLSVLSYALIFVFVVVLFGIFGLPVSGLIAGAGIVGLAIGFGAQGLVSDIVTGFFLLLEKQLDVGDFVTLAGFSGIVEEVGIRTTHIRGFDGTLNYIPNREISSLSNHSRGNMRALVDIGISYDENIDEAISVIQTVCNEVAIVDENIMEGPNVIGVQSLNSSDVVIRVIAKTRNMEQWGVERSLKKAIKEALDQNNIEIPFPHQVFIEKKV